MNNANFNNGMIIGSLLGLTVVKQSGTQYELEIMPLGCGEPVDLNDAEVEIQAVSAVTCVVEAAFLPYQLSVTTMIELMPFDIMEVQNITEYPSDIFILGGCEGLIEADGYEIEVRRFPITFVSLEVLV